MSTVLFNRDSINSSHYLMELSLFFFKELFNLKRSSLVPVTVNRSLFVCEARPSCGFVPAHLGWQQAQSSSPFWSCLIMKSFWVLHFGSLPLPRVTD